MAGFAHPPPDGRFQTIADIAGFWGELAQSRMTQSGHLLTSRPS